MVFLLFSLQSLLGQTIFGIWKTIDDKSGKEKALVEIYNKDGLVYGRILEILEEGKKDALCIKCEGDQKNRPIVGIRVIRDMEKDGDKYKGGRLFDPEHGLDVRGKIWLDPDNPDRLKVRGYVAFFYRTQTWHRVD